MLHEAILDREALELLKEYFLFPPLRNFSLAGGTALALRFGHRYCYYIDLFSYQKFDIIDIEKELESYFGLAYIKRGNLTNALFTTIRNIKTDLVFDYGNKFSDIETLNAIRIYPIEENIAMKLNAICGRGRKRDFYDLYFILKNFSLNEISDFFIKKFGEERLLFLYKSITYFDDAENDADPVLIKEKITWETVKKYILKTIRRID
jgi:hypothetical protein